MPERCPAPPRADADLELAVADSGKAFLFVPAGLDRTLLPGDHYSLLRRPEVERLARELTAQLAGIPSAGRR